MAIKGFQGTSLLDYPGRIASLIFFAGCNLTCPFCHNPSLVLNPELLPDYPPETILAELAARRQFIDGVVLTGGEPTSAPELIPFVEQLKQLGLLVKLDTNGLAPQVIDNLLRGGLIDFIALDLKTSPERYGELHQGPVSLGALERSVELLLQGQVDFELRTTCIPGFVEEEDVVRIGQLIQGAGSWVFQQFVPEHTLDQNLRGLVPHSIETLNRFVDLAKPLVTEVRLRGVE